MKNNRKNLKYTSTDKRKLTWKKIIREDMKMASLLIYQLESKSLSKMKNNFRKWSVT